MNSPWEGRGAEGVSFFVSGCAFFVEVGEDAGRGGGAKRELGVARSLSCDRCEARQIAGSPSRWPLLQKGTRRASHCYNWLYLKIILRGGRARDSEAESRGNLQPWTKPTHPVHTPSDAAAVTLQKHVGAWLL